MRYLVYFDAGTGRITRVVQSETAPTGKYGTGPCIVTLSHQIITAATHHVVDGAVIAKE